MQEHTAPRDWDRDFVFTGEVIGSGTSRAVAPANYDSRSKTCTCEEFERKRGRTCSHLRWFEVDIYRTQAGNYVVSGRGRSICEGERDRNWAYTVDTAEELIEVLYRTDRDGIRYLTRTVRDALESAADRDEAVDDALFTEVA